MHRQRVLYLQLCDEISMHPQFIDSSLINLFTSLTYTFINYETSQKATSSKFRRDISRQLAQFLFQNFSKFFRIFRQIFVLQYFNCLKGNPVPKRTSAEGASMRTCFQA